MNNDIYLCDEEIVDEIFDDEIQTTFLEDLENVEGECEIENVSN